MVTRHFKKLFSPSKWRGRGIKMGSENDSVSYISYLIIYLMTTYKVETEEEKDTLMFFGA